MSPMRMLKLFSATVVVGGFSVADVHAEWFCPKCNVKHEEAICPNETEMDRQRDNFGIWQPTWRCEACKAIHTPKQRWWWKDSKQPLVTCENGCWPCETCEAVHSAEDTFTQNAWCCPTCRTQHTDGRLYCEQTHGFYTKKVWFCTSCNKPHGTYQPCESGWFCEKCKKGHLIGETCSTGRWYCSACQKSYKAKESCQHSWNCPSDGGCGTIHRFDEKCPKHYRWCNEDGCKHVYDPDTPCAHCWECPTCFNMYGPDQICPTHNTWCCRCLGVDSSGTKSFCTECNRWVCSDCDANSAVKDGTAVCAHRWFCATHKQLNTANTKCSGTTCNIFGCTECGVQTSCCDHYWVCTKCYVLRDHGGSSVLCPDCQTGWYCKDCKEVRTGLDTDECNHPRPSQLNNTLRLKGKKTLLKKQSLVNDRLRLNAFKENHDPFAEVQSDGGNGKKENSFDRSFHSDYDQANQPILRATEKIIREKNKQTRNDRKEDLKKKSKRSSSSSSSSSSSDKDKKLVINTRKKNGLKTDGMKLTIVKPMNFEFKSSSKSSNTDKYPLLTQSHIKYSEKKEEPKDPSPKHKKELSSNASSDEERKRTLEGKPSSPNVSPKSKHKEESASDSDTSKPTFTEKKKEEKKVLQSSKAERPVLKYNLNLDALTNNLKNEPLAASGLSDFEQAAEVKEKSRLDGLKLQLKQNSKMQTSSGPKKKIVPSLSKVIKGGERKKADRSDNKESKKQSTFKPSSSSSDSDASETPKETPKGSNVYTNNTPGAVRKSSKKIYQEDEGNETPSNSQASSRFNLLKSPKNKHAAPNVSGAKPTSKKLPSASDSSQQIGLKTIEGPKKPTKEDTPKSNDITPIPNGNTPKEETPKSKDKKQSDSEASKKSDEENKSDDDKYSSNDDKKSSHSKSSKSSSKKSAHARSYDNHSEKHSDGEISKSDEGSDKEDESSEHNEESDAKNSEEEDEASKEEKELSEDSEK